MRGWVYLHTLDPPIAVTSTVGTHILKREGGRGEGGREGGRKGKREGGREGGGGGRRIIKFD